MKALCRKYGAAKSGLAKTGPAFTQLDAQAKPEWKEAWAASEANALEERGEAMCIYTVTLQTRKSE